MNTKQKIIIGTTVALFVAYLVTTTGFVNKKRQHIYCRHIDIAICDSAVNRFIGVKDILQLIDRKNSPLIGTPVDHINTRQIEDKLKTQSILRNAKASTSIDGVLHIRLYQRRPVIRVLTEQGSFYIDETGYIFPFSYNYTSYVPIVTGNIAPSFKVGYTGDIPDKDNLIKQLYTFGLFLDKHDFWQSQVLHLHVHNAHDIEIIPRVGNQLIKLGSLDNYEYKLKKLYTFYREALPNEGWECYSKVDLRYGNQVVATK
ncbi:MAG: hypothetical protein LBD91_03425 [Prevotellaceae bacterium]|nr:hypothetical protein [Prevotellaceae bacterium]